MMCAIAALPTHFLQALRALHVALGQHLLQLLHLIHTPTISQTSQDPTATHTRTLPTQATRTFSLVRSTGSLDDVATAETHARTHAHTQRA